MTTRTTGAAALLCAALAFTAPLAAQTTGDDGRPVARAIRADDAPSIDGRLDDTVWGDAPVIDHFTQLDPLEGEAVSQRTEVRLAYDDEALYIGARLWDDGEITSRLGRRDMDLLDADWFGVVIDAYHDHRTGFVFDVNPAGVQRDAIKSIGGGGDEQDDNSWDAVWEAATTVDAEGWTAEYRIPFSQLSFTDVDEHRWGLQLERVIGRNREYAVTSFTPKSEPGGIPTYGHLEGIEDIEPGDRLELLPYVLTRGEFVDPGRNPFRTDSESAVAIGGDLRFRVTSDLTLNASINPDFGQVEVDPAVINLGVYETRFDEKRPFFIEGSEIFDFGRNTSGGQLFYSRRIGRAPQMGAPTLEADVPDVTNIWGAAKLSGKTASGWSIGVIEALTAEESARYLDGESVTREAVVEPLANYLVARVRKDAREGRTSIGGMFTATSRQLDDDRTEGALRSGAYAGGLDFRLETDDRSWVVRGSAAMSHIRGSTESLRRVQRAGNHFFQRPDADHLEVAERTTMTGYSIGAAVERQGGTHWRGGLQLAATSPEYEINDLGFQTRTDRLDAQANVQYVQNQPGSFFRNYSVNTQARFEHNYDAQRILGVLSTTASFRHLDFWSGFVYVARNLRALDDRSTRGGPLMEQPANWTTFAGLNSDGRKPVQVGVHLNAARDEYDGWEAGANLRIGLRTSDRWNLSISPGLNRSSSGAQYVGTVADATADETYGARYLFAPIEQTTVSLETRLNVTFTPRLSLETYVQPFISTGDYGAVASLVRPQSYEFEAWDGQAPNRDFTFRSLRGNAVLRWEWRPGSTMYLAWQQSRSSSLVPPSDGAGDFDFGRDRRGLFSAPDNIFLLKVSYWFTP